MATRENEDRENSEAAMLVGEIRFFDTPDDIEGSPYWVDLWASVNGYRLGLQVKPSSHKAASTSIYVGKTRNSQTAGHRLFQEHYGGKVITVTIKNGSMNARDREQILAERDRLMNLPAGRLQRVGNQSD